MTSMCFFVHRSASSARNNVTVFIEQDKVSQISCIMSSLTRSPLISLDGRPHELHEVDQCRYVMSVSGNSESYGLATKDMVTMNTGWSKIVILYESKLYMFLFTNYSFERLFGAAR
jgi:hypothetical protein